MAEANFRQKASNFLQTVPLDNTPQYIPSLISYFTGKAFDGATPQSAYYQNIADTQLKQSALDNMNAQRNFQISNQNYRNEAEKTAVAGAASQNAQTVTNQGNASAGAAAINRNIGAADYNTYMQRSDSQRALGEENQRSSSATKVQSDYTRAKIAQENYNFATDMRANKEEEQVANPQTNQPVSETAKRVVQKTDTPETPASTDKGNPPMYEAGKDESGLVNIREADPRGRALNNQQSQLNDLAKKTDLDLGTPEKVSKLDFSKTTTNDNSNSAPWWKKVYQWINTDANNLVPGASQPRGWEAYENASGNNPAMASAVNILNKSFNLGSSYNDIYEQLAFYKQADTQLYNQIITAANSLGNFSSIKPRGMIKFADTQLNDAANIVQAINQAAKKLGSTNTVSDVREKDIMFTPEDIGDIIAEYRKQNNITDPEPDEYTDDMVQEYASHLRNFLYTYKPEATSIDPSIDPEEFHRGPMAQDIEKVAPDCVKETQDGTKVVDGDRLALVNAGVIGDLARRILALEQKVGK